MTLFTAIVASALLAAPMQDATPETIRLSSLQSGDQLEITTTAGSFVVEIVDPTDGEVRLATSAFHTPVRAYLNGSTQGPQPERFVMMGVVKTGLRLEIVETKTGGAGDPAKRWLTPTVTAIKFMARDRAA